MPLPWGDFQLGESYRMQWKYVQHILETVAEGLSATTANEAEMGQHRTQPTQGYIVLMMCENTPRGAWPLWLIIDVKQGRDCLVRRATVKTKSPSSVRSVSKMAWPLVTDMQHHYHARYPTDDWHLTCMFSLVYLPVEVCLVGMCPHYVSIWSDPWIGACIPLMYWRPPTRENNIVQGVARFSTWAKRGCIGVETRVCLHYMVVIGVAGYCNIPLYCTVFGVYHGHDTYGLKVVFCLRHFTTSHCHNYARVLTGVEYL